MNSHCTQNAKAWVCYFILGSIGFFGSPSHGQNTNSLGAPAPAQAKAVDFHLQSRDRMFEGSILVSDDWKHVSFRFINVTTAQVLGTYPDVLENMGAAKSTFKIYAHRSDMFSDQDMQDAKTDPNVTEQAVTFFKDDDNPKILHFASTFDKVGTMQIQVLHDGQVVAYGERKLIEDPEFSSLIQSTDDAISGKTSSTTNEPATNVPTPGQK